MALTTMRNCGSVKMPVTVANAGIAKALASPEVGLIAVSVAAAAMGLAAPPGKEPAGLASVGFPVKEGAVPCLPTNGSIIDRGVAKKPIETQCLWYPAVSQKQIWCRWSLREELRSAIRWLGQLCPNRSSEARTRDFAGAVIKENKGAAIGQINAETGKVSANQAARVGCILRRGHIGQTAGVRPAAAPPLPPPPPLVATAGSGLTTGYETEPTLTATTALVSAALVSTAKTATTALVSAARPAKTAATAAKTATATAAKAAATAATAVAAANFTAGSTPAPAM